MYTVTLKSRIALAKPSAIRDVYSFVIVFAVLAFTAIGSGQTSRYAKPPTIVRGYFDATKCSDVDPLQIAALFETALKSKVAAKEFFQTIPTQPKDQLIWSKSSGLNAIRAIPLGAASRQDYSRRYKSLQRIVTALKSGSAVFAVGDPKQALAKPFSLASEIRDACSFTLTIHDLQLKGKISAAAIKAFSDFDKLMNNNMADLKKAPKESQVSKPDLASLDKVWSRTFQICKDLEMQTRTK